MVHHYIYNYVAARPSAGAFPYAVKKLKQTLHRTPKLSRSSSTPGAAPAVLTTQKSVSTAAPVSSTCARARGRL